MERFAHAVSGAQMIVIPGGFSGGDEPDGSAKLITAFFRAEAVREQVTALLERYPIHTVVYGHLHGQAVRVGFQGEHHGIRYRLVSCDSLGFRLAEIPLDSQM